MPSFFYFNMVSLHLKCNHCNFAETMNVRTHLLVYGIVQGVGFRYFVYHQAVDLDLKGYVRNTFSGEVEIEAEGDRSLIEEFIKQVRIGPRSAHVTDVKIEWINCKHTDTSFQIK
jgi:acylphosphatase